LQLRFHEQKLYVASLYAARNAKECWKKLPEARDERGPRFSAAVAILRCAMQDFRSIPTDRDEEFGNECGRERWEQYLRSWENELLHLTLRVDPRSYAPQN
jgi:hypothetical protein